MSSHHRRHREVADPQRDDSEFSEPDLAGKDEPSVFSLEDDEIWLHNHGVVALTLRLARAVGMKEEELIHVRRGALLHDIGMVGIPDEIIFKPGQLTEQEWGIVRRHPAFARDLLSTTGALTPALDIPYCHHEKWDGTGYPRGLKGEQIPLAARIFAVVDVWDALSSDRPYRSALPRESVFLYLNEQAGKHFDPNVVQAFISLEMPDLSQPRPVHALISG